MFQAAMTFREVRLCELDEERHFLETTLPAWAVEAYKAAERAFRTVEGESATGDTPNDNVKIVPTGNPLFAAIEDAVATREMKSDGGDLESVEQYFERHPQLSAEICDFLKTNEL